MRLYVDADACPRVIKEILYRAVQRTQVPLLLVSSLNLKNPDILGVDCLNIPGGMDAVDQKIIELVEPGDLVITADIPLADHVVRKGALALDPRGDFHTPSTIHQRLAVRNLMDQLRGQGMLTGGPAVFNHQDRLAFANQLDKFLAKTKRAC